MGVFHRKKRAHEKKLAHWFGVKEDELGQLRKKMTKAEARRQLIGKAYRRVIENEIVDAAIKRARDEICAQEDEAFIADLDRLLGTSSVQEVSP